MKKRSVAFILAVCLILLASALLLFTACDDGERAIDLSLRADRDYGIYWYDAEGETMLSREDMPEAFYDPEKPTVIYSHGWKSDLSAEEFSTQQSTITATSWQSGSVDYAAELKKAGYNVGFFDWHLYAKDLGSLQDEIWTVATSFDMTDTSNHALAFKKLNGRTFAGEFAREIAAVMKNAVNEELHFVGHSFGAQMVIAAAYTLAEMQAQGIISNPNCVPDRISLADPYLPPNALKGDMDIIGKALNTTTHGMDADVLEYLKNKGAFIDIYGANVFIYELYNLGGKEEAVKSKILANCAFVELSGMVTEYKNKDSHVMARDYVLTNLVSAVGDTEYSLPFTVATSAKDGIAYAGKLFRQEGGGFDAEEVRYVEISA